MKKALLIVLSFSILSLSCRNQIKQQAYIERNEQAAANLVLGSGAMGNGVLFEIGGEKYILTVAHLCDIREFLSEININSEEGKAVILGLASTVASKTFCQAVFTVPNTLNKAKMGLANMVAIDFDKDLMLMKIFDPVEFKSAFSPSMKSLKEVKPSERIYAITLFESITDSVIVSFSRAGDIISLKSKKIHEPRLLAQFGATNGYSGLSIYSMNGGYLVGLLSAEVIFGNPVMPSRITIIVEAKSIKEFIKIFLYTSKELICFGDHFACMIATGDTKGLSEYAKTKNSKAIKGEKK